METKLRKIRPLPQDIDKMSLSDVWEKHARMKRALYNWREAINGKVSVKVADENKEWLLELCDETQDLIIAFEQVFEN